MMRLLKDRTDTAAEMTKQMATEMIDKIFVLKEMKKNVQKKSDQKILQAQERLRLAKREKEKAGSEIEKDIYNFENAIKHMIGTKEFYRLKQNYEFKHGVKRTKKEKML